MIVEKTVKIENNEDFQSYAKFREGLRKLDDNFLKFMFLLNRRQINLSEKQENIQKEIITIINSKKNQRFFGELIIKLIDFLGVEILKKFIEERKTYSDDDLNYLLNHLLGKRFDIEFESTSLISCSVLKKNLEIDSEKEDLHFIASTNEKERKYFIFTVGAKNQQTGLNENLPIYGNTYTYYLVRYNLEKKTTELKGVGMQYFKIKNIIEKNISEEPANDIFKFPKENLLLDLIKSRNFSLIGFDYGDYKNLYIKAKSSMYDINFIVNNLLLLTDSLDFFDFKTLEFKYNDSENEIFGKIKINLSYSGGYFSLKTIINGDIDDKKIIDEKIKKIFGIEIGKKYFLEEGLYLKRLFLTNKKETLYKQILRKKELNKILSFFEQNKIIESEKNKISTNLKNLKKIFKDKIDVLSKYKSDDFQIESVDIKGDIVNIFGYYSETQTSYKRYFNLPVSFSYKKDGCCKVINFDLYEIFSNSLTTDKEKEKLFLYISKKIRFFDLLQQQSSDSEALESYNYLTNRERGLNLMEPKQRGYHFEDSTNILLKSIFSTFVRMGSSENPDGLFILNEKLFITDSKSKESIDASDLDELFRYLKKKEDISSFNVNEKRGIFIYDEMISKSLNIKNCSKWSEDNKKDISYLSASFLLNFFEFFKTNRDVFFLNPVLLGKIHKKIISLMEKNESKKINKYREIKKQKEFICKNETDLLKEMKDIICTDLTITEKIKRIDEKYNS